MKWAIALLCVAAAVPAAAQQPAPSSFSVGGGVTWSGGYSIGDAAGIYRTNASGATPPPFTLFSAASDFGSTAGFDVRLDYGLSPRFAIDGGLSLSFPHVATEISGDAESAPQTLQGERLQQYLFDAAIVWFLPVPARRGMIPFVSGGGGYLRQLHEERTLIESGQVYYFGGGVRYWLRAPAARGPALGLNGSVRANFRVSGIDFENQMRVYPTFALLLMLHP